MIQCCGVDKPEPWRDALLHVFIQGGATSTRSPLAMQIQQPFMNRQLLLSQFEKLLPLAANWAAAVEKRILREGVPLSEQGLADARSLGVREPERVRLLALAMRPHSHGSHS